MFKRGLKEAFEWSFKWYLGSFSTTVATFFFFEKYLEYDRTRSILDTVFNIYRHYNL